MRAIERGRPDRYANRRATRFGHLPVFVSGTAFVTGRGPARILDVTETVPRWVDGTRVSGDGARGFRLEEGRRYLASATAHGWIEVIPGSLIADGQKSGESFDEGAPRPQPLLRTMPPI